MPTIHIYTIPRSDDQRRLLVQGITQSAVDALGVDASHVRILVHETPPTCTANGGKLLSDTLGTG